MKNILLTTITLTLVLAPLTAGAELNILQPRGHEEPKVKQCQIVEELRQEIKTLKQRIDELELKLNMESNDEVVEEKAEIKNPCILSGVPGNYTLSCS